MNNQHNVQEETKSNDIPLHINLKIPLNNILPPSQPNVSNNNLNATNSVPNNGRDDIGVGHVFLAYCDITRISCDYLLLPDTAHLDWGNYPHLANIAVEIAYHTPWLLPRDIVDVLPNVPSNLNGDNKGKKTNHSTESDEWEINHSNEKIRPLHHKCGMRTSKLYSTKFYPQYKNILRLNLSPMHQSWPIPILVNNPRSNYVEQDSKKALDFMMYCVKQAFHAIALSLGIKNRKDNIDNSNNTLKDNPIKKPRNRRNRYVIALPMFGTGFGKFRGQRAAVINALLNLLYEITSEYYYEFDTILCTNEKLSYDVAQSCRAKKNINLTFNGLDKEIFSVGDLLAKRALSNELVLFLGAGCSMAAGLPSWEGLLWKIGEQIGMKQEELKLLSNLPFIDRAKIIQNYCGGEAQLQHLVAKMLSTPHFALAHCLLASLPVNETITSNYDVLFEMANQVNPQALKVLPYETLSGIDNKGNNNSNDNNTDSNDNSNNSKRFLLKMHGCISCPEDIVLNRSRYIRYEHQKGALFGIVQTLLITKHMLFVGFSMQDDNMHKIVDTVQKIRNRSILAHMDNKLNPIDPNISKSPLKPFAHALMLDKQPLSEILWKGDVQFVSMCGSLPHSNQCSNCLTADEKSDVNKFNSEAARKLEIFLDYVAYVCANKVTDHLFNPDFSDTLNEQDIFLAKQLQIFASNLPSSYLKSNSYAFSKIVKCISELGGEFNPDINGLNIVKKEVYSDLGSVKRHRPAIACPHLYNSFSQDIRLHPENIIQKHIARGINKLQCSVCGNSKTNPIYPSHKAKHNSNNNNKNPDNNNNNKHNNSDNNLTNNDKNSTNSNNDSGLTNNSISLTNNSSDNNDESSFHELLLDNHLVMCLRCGELCCDNDSNPACIFNHYNQKLQDSNNNNNDDEIHCLCYGGLDPAIADKIKLNKSRKQRLEFALTSSLVWCCVCSIWLKHHTFNKFQLVANNCLFL